MKDNRCELIKGNIIIVAGKDYIVDSVIGRGASCICYKAYTKEAAMIEGKPEIKTWRVIKEFYPVNIAIRDSFMKVVPAFDDLTTWENSQKRWKEAVDKGREFQAQDGNNFMEIEVADLSYTVMRLREGMTLGNWVQKNIPAAQNDNSDDERVRTQYVVKCLNILRDLCACIEKYQGDGKIHFDVKPENIYILADNNDKLIVRLIDYDSLMEKDEFYKIAGGDGKISMYSTKQYYGEEVWSLRSDWKATATDENVWKQVDVYALGKVLQYMLTGNADDTLFFADNFEWFKDKDPVIKRTSSRRYVLNGFIKKATNVFGHRYSDASTVKFVVENILGLFHDNNFEMFDGFNKYRDELVPELMVDGISYVKHRGNAPIVQVFEEYCAKQNKNICVVAESGMGKSTALRKLFIDKILENQCVNRYYYCPLRDYAKSAPRVKKLWQDIKDSYGYPSCERQYFLLDAFDETNESDEDLQDALKYRLNAIPENAAVVLTSRFVVKDLRDYKIVACGKIGLTDYSDDIIRIKNNSDWLERVGIDIFQNPLFITMSENIEQIRHYIIHDKETGKTAWENIEAELLGECVNDKLTINYAGELIWNYVYVTILSKFIFDDCYSDILLTLHSITFGKEYRELYLDYKRADKLGVQKSIIIDNFIKKLTEEKIILRQKEAYRFISYINLIIINNPMLYLSFLDALHLLQFKNYGKVRGEDIAVDSLEEWQYLSDRKISIQIYNLAAEISGYRYNSIVEREDNFLGNLTESIICKYRDVIYLGYKNYEYKKGKRLSDFQEKNRCFLYEILKAEKKRCSRKSETKNFSYKPSQILNIIFSEEENISFIDFSNLDLGSIFYFKTIKSCLISNSLLQVCNGSFVDCIIKNLKERSFLLEEMYINNTVDKKYEVKDHYGNCITSDKKYVVSLYDYEMLEKKIKLHLKGILYDALKNCVNTKLSFGQNFDFIDFSCSNNSGAENRDTCTLLPVDIINVNGNADLVGLEYINNIRVQNSTKYFYHNGILYYNSRDDGIPCYNDYIVHINRRLPKEVTLFSSFSRISATHGLDYIGCERLILDKNIDMRFIGTVLTHNFINLREINNLPKGVCIILGMLIDFRDETFNPTILNILSYWYSLYNIIYIPEDMGLYLDWSYYRSVLKNKKRIFRPCLYHSDDAVEWGKEEYNVVIQQSSDSIPWDHTFDNFWHEKFDWLPIVLTRDDADWELYDGFVVEVYDELTEDEKEEVNEQRNKWIEYIKSLPPGKKHR